MSPGSTEQRRHHVGAASDFVEDQFCYVDVDGREVGVVRTGRGFFAVWNRCPHQGARICSGRVSGTMVPSSPGEYRYAEEELVLVCPWHRWEFDLATGKSFGAVTRKRLVTFPVVVEDGQVYVTSPQRPRRRAPR